MKRLNNFGLSIALSMSILLVGCKDDEVERPSYEFKDQNLQGEIGGVEWNFGTGFFEESANGPDEVFIKLYNGDIGRVDICEFEDGEVLLASMDIPAEAGLYELNFDATSEDNQVVVMYDPDGLGDMVAIFGAVEIISISDTELKGRMDARAGEDSFLNGNFTVSFCN